MPEPRDVPLRTPVIRVLALLAQGESRRQIATALGCSANTVSNRVARACEHLGARSPEQAVLLAYRAGLIGLPSDVGAGLRRATSVERPGAVWWQHACGTLDAFPADWRPEDGSCAICGSSSPHRVDWRPVWVGDQAQAVQA